MKNEAKMKIPKKNSRGNGVLGNAIILGQGDAGSNSLGKICKKPGEPENRFSFDVRSRMGRRGHLHEYL